MEFSFDAVVSGIRIVENVCAFWDAPRETGRSVAGVESSPTSSTDPTFKRVEDDSVSEEMKSGFTATGATELAPWATERLGVAEELGVALDFAAGTA
jgi:hypothetical protein